MNREQHEEYLELKDKIMILENSISDRNFQIQKRLNQISENNALVADIKAKLAIEDRAIERKSILEPPTLSAEQYLAHKSTAERFESELPELNESIDYLNRSLALLQHDLNAERQALKAVKDKIAVDLVGTYLSELVAVAREPFENLVVSIIAAKGKDKGHSASEREMFEAETYKAVFKEILPAIFYGNGLPDLYEANECLTELIEIKDPV